MNEVSKFPDNLVDKYGKPIKEDDVIYDGKDYYTIYWNELHPQVEAFSPTYGYIHNLTNETLAKFERIGTSEECEDIMTVD